MRTTLSFLVAALAGLLAVLATAGALVDEATHRPELLRGVTEQVAVDPEVRAAVPGVIDDVVHDAIPEQVPGPLAQVAEDLLRPLASVWRTTRRWCRAGPTPLTRPGAPGSPSSRTRRARTSPARART